MEAMELRLENRTVLGKQVRALRREGYIPVHMYGKGIEPLFLQGEARLLKKVVAKAGQSTLLLVSTAGNQEPLLAFVREVQVHPVTDEVLHIDLLRVDASEPIVGEVPVEVEGEAPAVRVHAGILSQIHHSLRVRCLPADMPRVISVDVSSLTELDQGIRVADIKVDPKVAVLEDLEMVVVRIARPRKVEEVAAAAVEEVAAPEAVEVEGGKTEEKPER